VADFLGWQEAKTLELNPYFQRRPVWTADQKSYFMDTILRGLPVPIIYIRRKTDLATLELQREVVDGQQRLRTVIGYVREDLLEDFQVERDRFFIKQVHNRECAGLSFRELPESIQDRILGYEFSTHVLPSSMEDINVLEMFARLNATGVKLNRQELRNARWFGEFKTIMYELGLEQLDRWRRWRIFSHQDITRMREVETASDLVMNMVEGLVGKTQRRLDRTYEKYDETFPNADEVKRRFRDVMDLIEDTLGGSILKTVYTSKVYFFTLFIFLYDILYGLGSPLEPKKAIRPTEVLVQCLLEVSRHFADKSVPADVLDAVQRASSDTGRRRKRLDYLLGMYNGTMSR